MKDTYNTIKAHSSVPTLFKEKNSKFYGYAFYVTQEEAVKTHLTAVKKAHHAARHWCYAYQIGTTAKVFRVQDDGEPSNSAGMPIYGQLQAFDLTNVLIIVVRYFGGVKLGVGGLIQAYKTAAQLTLTACDIIEKTINIAYEVSFEYKDMNKVMRVIKDKKIHITTQRLELDCSLIISVRQKEALNVFETFNSIFGVKIKPTAPS